MKTIKLMMMTLMMCCVALYSCVNENKEIEKDESNKVPSTGTIQVEDGTGKNTEIEYELLFNLNDSISFTNLYDVAERVNSLAKRNCMNERTFKPVKMQMFQKSGSDTINVTYKFIAANSYGVEDNLSKLVLVSLDSLQNKNYNFILEDFE